MRRRAFLGAVMAGAAAIPFAAYGQTSARPLRIGELDFGVPGSRIELAAFRQQMRKLGYIEGQNALFETRYASLQRSTLDDFARDLVARPVDIIVATSSITAASAKRATLKIPIVMILVTDAVGQGLVASLARPGGNVTGLTTLSAELAPKRLELLKELIPGLTRVALFATRTNEAFAMHVSETEEGARALRISLDVHDVRSPDDLEAAFSAVARTDARAIVVMPGPTFHSNRARVAALAIGHRLPIMCTDKLFTRAGALLSYGPSYADLFRRAAFYVDRIAKGASPAELPVEQPSKFELVVNLKTAQAIGIAIPHSVLARADEVIE